MQNLHAESPVLIFLIFLILTENIRNHYSTVILKIPNIYESKQPYRFLRGLQKKSKE